MSATNVDRSRRLALPRHCSKAPPALDTIHFQSRVGALGTFNCPVGHPRFRDSGAIERPIVVFPRTSVWIQHDGSSPFVADPSVVTIYNRAQCYERRAIAADGDVCDWIAIDDDLARDIVHGSDPHAADHVRGPFCVPCAPSSPALYLQQRLLLRRAVTKSLEPLAIEEELLEIVTRVLTSAHTRHRHSPPRWRATSRRHRALAEAAKEEVLHHVHENTSVRDIADALGASVFHLCRVFRRETGQTLHAYRTDLRLRLMFESLGDTPGASLSTLAFSLGFSSHAHLVRHCRDRLGASPSTLRALLATPRGASRDISFDAPPTASRSV